MIEKVRPGGTYKTPAEQQEVLSPAEERFEGIPQTAGLFLGPIVFLIMFSPSLSSTGSAIPIPVTAVPALALCVILNLPGAGLNAEDSPGDIVYGSFADDTIFPFIGAFIIAQAMVTHGLDRHLVFRILSLPGVARSTYGVRFQRRGIVRAWPRI